MDDSASSIFFSWLPMLLWYGIPAIASAYFVFKDASKNRNLALGIPPIIWAVFCIPTDVLGLLAYWLMHHSSFSKRDGQ